MYKAGDKIYCVDGITSYCAKGEYSIITEGYSKSDVYNITNNKGENYYINYNELVIYFETVNQRRKRIINEL